MDTSGYIVILAGLIVIAVIIFQPVRRYFFLKKHSTTQVGGSITEMGRSENQRDDDSPTTVSYSMKYQYSVDGVEYSKSRSLSKRTYSTLSHDPNAESDITIFYDPSKPKRHYILEIKYRIILRLALIATVTFLILGYYYWSLGEMTW